MTTREKVNFTEGSMLGPTIEDKTLCRDLSTCEALNDFLEAEQEGKKENNIFGFTLAHKDHTISTSIDTRNMKSLEISELSLRIMKFLVGEIEKVKNAS